MFIFILEIVERPSSIGEHELMPAVMYYPRPRRQTAMLVYIFLILVLVLQLIFIRVISSRMIEKNLMKFNDFMIVLFVERVMIHKLSEELEDTNKRLDEINTISVEDIEEKLTKQVIKKNHKIIFIFISVLCICLLV